MEGRTKLELEPIGVVATGTEIGGEMGRDTGGETGGDTG